MTEKQCPTCKTVLFEVLPFKTTQQEIAEFIQCSTTSDEIKQTVLKSKWLHPGLYCANGCYSELYEVDVLLPVMTLGESIAIANKYSYQHFAAFLETHGTNSRIAACIYCKKFGGATLEGESPTAIYRQATLKPLRNHKIIGSHCADERIQSLPGEWWYSKGQIQAECDFFEYNHLFKRAFKEVTGWSEYPDLTKT